MLNFLIGVGIIHLQLLEAVVWEYYIYCYWKQWCGNTTFNVIGSSCVGILQGQLLEAVKVMSSMARSLPVENLLPQNVGSIINYLQ